MKNWKRQMVKLPDLRQGGSTARRHMRTASTGATIPPNSGSHTSRYLPFFEPLSQISFDQVTASTIDPDYPISLDPDFSAILSGFPSDSPLPFELEVNYRISHPGLVRQKDSEYESFLPPSSKTEVLPASLHPAIPHSKKNPSSLYNGSRNPASLEQVVVYPFLVQRIKAIAQTLASAFAIRTNLLEGRLLACFKACVETESKEYYGMWDRILGALEEATEREVENSEEIDPGLSHMLSSLRDLAKSDPSSLNWTDSMSDLTQRLRLVLSKMRNRQQAMAVETLWACGVYFTSRCLAQPQPRCETETSEKDEKCKEKPDPLESPVILHRRIEALSETVKQLQTTNERLMMDAEHYMSLIKDREAELKELHSFASLRDLDRFTEELNAYLSDAEGRQIANREVLESISQLLNHKWTAAAATSQDKRNKSRKLTVRPPRLTSPSPRSRMHSDDQQAPSKKPRGATTFFSSQSNASSRAGSPHLSRADSPAASPSIRESESTIIQGEVPSPRLPQVDSVTGRGFTTICIEICPVVMDEERECEVNTGEKHRNGSKGTINVGVVPIIEESKDGEMLPEVHVSVTEENESDIDSESATFEDKFTQTELKMSEFMLKDSEVRVPGPARRKKPNLLLMQLEKLEKKQLPMPEKLVFKLFEAAMDEKMHSDNMESDSGRPPKSMTEFMLDFLYMQYGLKTITLKNLSSLINALEIMSERNNPYGVLFCRLLEVFTEEPIDDTLAIFLTKARAAFVSLQNKAKSTLITKLFPELGGKVALSEVADLIYVLFLSDREAGEAVLAHLMPADMSEVDRAAVLFCGKLAKTGRELKFFYIQIDTEKTGSVKYQAFEKGVRETCEVPVSKGQTLALWRSLETDSLSFAQLTKLNFKDYSLKASSKELSISKCDFMYEIAREYERQRTAERIVLTALFKEHDPQGEGVMNLEEFTKLITGMNLEISKTKAVSIFREALDYSDNPNNLDSLDPSGFCHIALKYRLGNAGRTVFDSDLKQLSDRLRDQFIRYEHESGNMAVATNRFSRRFSKIRALG